MRLARITALIALATLSGCAILRPNQTPTTVNQAAQQIVASTGAIVARSRRYGLIYGATGGSDVGSFPNASALSGNERILADQSSQTVNILPSQIATYLGLPVGLTFPLSVANGGTGTASPALIAGTNVTITGTWPNQTVNASGGSGSGTVNSGTTNQVGCYTASGTTISGCTTLPTAAMPALAGDLTGTNGSLNVTVSKVTGTSGTPTTITFYNNTSGTGTVEEPAGVALGTLTYTLPVASGTFFLMPTTTTAGQCAQSTTTAGLGAWAACGSGGMVYPGAGIPNSTGSAWGTSITLSSNTVLGNSGSGAAALTPQQAIGVLNSGTANAQTGTSYTSVLSDGNGEVTMSNASANTFCIPPNSSVAYALGTVLTVQEAGAGVTTIAPAGTSGCSGTGVTVTSSTYGSSSSQTYSLGGIYGFIQIQQSATNTWNVIAWTVPPQSARSILNALVALGSGTTLTPNCSGATNSFTATGNITVALPTGCTPYDGQTIQLHVVSGSAAETYTANAGYAANSTVSWPAATAGTSGYVDIITIIYSSSLSKWMLGAYTLGNH